MQQFKMKNRGMMGVGTLIIFIAVILIAAVAAAVLVLTAGSLQQRALLTGEQAEKGVSTGAELMSVMATDATSGNTVEDFEVLLRLQPGSQTINLNTTVIIFDTGSTSQSMEYSGGTSYTTTHYGVSYVKKSHDYLPGYLRTGEIIKVGFASAINVTESSKVKLKIIPRVGQPIVKEIPTPDVMTDRRMNLWPR